MALEHVDRFVSLAITGAGLLLIGGVNLLGMSWLAWVRVSISLLIAGLSISTAAIWTESYVAAGRVAGLIALGLLPSLFSSSFFQSIWQLLRRLFARPIVHWSTLSAIGLLLVVGSTLRFEVEDNEWTEKDSRDALSAVFLTSHTETKGIIAATDRGTKIKITDCLTPRDEQEIKENATNLLRNTGHIDFVIHRQPPSERCNCHGWVFANGRYAINGEMVDTILSENGYQVTTDPRPGDLVIYRNDEGMPSHSGIVRYVSSGLPVLVEGKWGWMGVYLHDVDKSIYGVTYKYYRSTRSGHLLRLFSNDSASPAP